MAQLTPVESDRIIQAHLENVGATAPSLMAAWRAMVFQMMERLDLGQHRAECIALARDIVNLWGAVQPALTYPPDHQFLFVAGEVERVRGLFVELNRLAMNVLLSRQTLPSRSRRKGEEEVEHINEIAKYIRERLQLIDEMKAQGGDATGIYVTAGEMTSVLNRCMTLLAIVLGPEHVKTFKSQYDACIGTWNQAINLMRMDTDGPPS